MDEPQRTKRGLLRRLAIVVGVLIVAGAVGFWIVTIPATVSAADLPPYTPNLANGKTLVAAGGCAACHAVPNTNPDKVVPIIASHLKSDPAAVAATPRTIFAERLVAAQIQPWIDVTARYAKFPAFPSADLVYSPHA